MIFERVDNPFGEKGLESEAIKEVADELVRGNDFVFPLSNGVGD